MEAHKCLHEVDLALMAKEVKDNREDTREILKLLKGSNEGKGLVTKVALHGASIKRAWWWLGGISLAIAGIAFYVIKGVL